MDGQGDTGVKVVGGVGVGLDLIMTTVHEQISGIFLQQIKDDGTYNIR